MAKTIHSERARTFRDLLKGRRLLAGLSRTVLAQRLGKAPSYVEKYESGDRRLDFLEFMDVADAIGLDPADVICALRQKYPPTPRPTIS